MIQFDFFDVATFIELFFNYFISHRPRYFLMFLVALQVQQAQLLQTRTDFEQRCERDSVATKETGI